MPSSASPSDEVPVPQDPNWWHQAQIDAKGYQNGYYLLIRCDFMAYVGRRGLADSSGADGSPGSEFAEPTATAAAIKDPRGYLSAYWPEVPDSECKFILSFLHGTYKEISRLVGELKVDKVQLAEIGGGPVVDKLISASRVATSIFHLDASADSLLEVQKVCDGSPDGFDWGTRFEFIAALEGNTATDVRARFLKTPLETGLIDLLASEGLESYIPAGVNYARGSGTSESSPASSIRIVSSHSVAECITQSMKDFKMVLGRIAGLCCEPGDHLVMTLNTNTTVWSGGDRSIPATPVTREQVLELLGSLGFRIMRTATHTADEEEDTAMPSTLALWAVKGDDDSEGDAEEAAAGAGSKDPAETAAISAGGYPDSESIGAKTGGEAE